MCKEIIVVLSKYMIVVVHNRSDVVEGVEKKEEPFIFLTKDDPDWPCLR